MSGHEHSLSPTVLRIATRENERSSWQVFVGWLQYLMMRASSCWHREMSRPFTHEGASYRICLRCGMKRNFDLQNWRMKGRYHNDARIVRDVSAPVIRDTQPAREWKFRIHTPNDDNLIRRRPANQRPIKHRV